MKWQPGANELINCGLVTQILVNIDSGLWLVSCSLATHFLNQCQLIVKWTFRNKLQWNFNQNTKKLICDDGDHFVEASTSSMMFPVPASRCRSPWTPAWRSPGHLTSRMPWTPAGQRSRTSTWPWMKSSWSQKSQRTRSSLVMGMWWCLRAVVSCRKDHP